MYQLELELTSRTDLAVLLHAAGLPSDVPVLAHTNRRVLVSLTRRGVLRVHAGYRFAPVEVLAAIARWARPRCRRVERRAALRILVAFPVHQHAPPSSPPRRRPEVPPAPGDPARLARLGELFEQFNRKHFGGRLAVPVIRLSSRMRRRLGIFHPADAPGLPPEIVLSRGHLRRDGWARTAETLLHEMVHQWQWESGLPLAHDRTFRMRCAEVGIEGRAVARFANDLPPSGVIFHHGQARDA